MVKLQVGRFHRADETIEDRALLPNGYHPSVTKKQAYRRSINHGIEVDHEWIDKHWQRFRSQWKKLDDLVKAALRSRELSYGKIIRRRCGTTGRMSGMQTSESRGMAKYNEVSPRVAKGAEV